MKIFISRVMFVKDIFSFFLIFYSKYKTKLTNIAISNIKMKAKLKLVFEICSYFLNLNIKVLIGREINLKECIEMFIR